MNGYGQVAGIRISLACVSRSCCISMADVNVAVEVGLPPKRLKSQMAETESHCATSAKMQEFLCLL